MNTQSMVRAVITGASSAIGTVDADRLGLNRHQNTTDSSSREVLVGSSV
jgi:short-subunit dehydrogenase